MPSERRWIILAQDGRHVTMGRAAPPSEAEVEADVTALAAQGLADGSQRRTATTGRAAAWPSRRCSCLATALRWIAPPPSRSGRHFSNTLLLSAHYHHAEGNEVTRIGVAMNEGESIIQETAMVRHDTPRSEPIREAPIHAEGFAARRRSMMRIMAIRYALPLFTPHECRNYFTAVGHEPE